MVKLWWFFNQNETKEENKMWIIAIIAMLCWSGSDIFSKIGSNQQDKLSHYKVGIAVGLIMGIHAMYEIIFGDVPLSFSDIINYLPASAFYIISMVFSANCFLLICIGRLYWSTGIACR